MSGQKSAEGIVGSPTGTKGPNMSYCKGVERFDDDKSCRRMP